MTADDTTRARVVALMAEILEIDAATIHGNDRLREDLGMDSLTSLEFLSAVSHELKLDLEIEDALAIVTVDDAWKFITAHQAAQQGARGVA